MQWDKETLLKKSLVSLGEIRHRCMYKNITSQKPVGLPHPRLGVTTSFVSLGKKGKDFGVREGSEWCSLRPRSNLKDREEEKGKGHTVGKKKKKKSLNKYSGVRSQIS